MASKAETQQLAGELLRLVPIGQALQAHHDVRMGEAYDEVYAELEVLGLPMWGSNEMPDEITPHFVNLMAYNKADLYGISDALYQRILLKVGDKGEKAKDDIKSLMAEDYYSSNDPTDY